MFKDLTDEKNDLLCTVHSLAQTVTGSNENPDNLWETHLHTLGQFKGYVFGASAMLRRLRALHPRAYDSYLFLLYVSSVDD